MIKIIQIEQFAASIIVLLFNWKFYIGGHDMKRKRVICIIFAGLLIAGLVSCANTEEKLAEKMMEKNLEAAGLDGDVNYKDGELTIEGDDVNVNLNGGQKWPDYIPKSIPEFKKGDVTSAIQMGTNISITALYDGNAFSDYANEYKKASWEQVAHMNDDVSGEETFVFENDEYMVYLIDRGGGEL